MGLAESAGAWEMAPTTLRGLRRLKWLGCTRKLGRLGPIEYLGIRDCLDARVRSRRLGAWRRSWEGLLNISCKYPVSWGPINTKILGLLRNLGASKRVGA